MNPLPGGDALHIKGTFKCFSREIGRFDRPIFLVHGDHGNCNFSAMRLGKTHKPVQATIVDFIREVPLGGEPQPSAPWGRNHH